MLPRRIRGRIKGGSMTGNKAEVKSLK